MFRPVWCVFIIILYCESTHQFINSGQLQAPGKYWLVEIEGGFKRASQIAREYGYTIYKQVTGFENLYVFESIRSNSRKRSQILSKSLINRPEISLVQQQIELPREKRFILVRLNPNAQEELDNIDDQFFNDEFWENEWYLKNSGHDFSRQLNLNVLPVYKRGITGRGIRVTVLDDGLEYTHEDLAPNFDPDISWDCINNLPDPRPRGTNQSHGTRCAGEIAMVGNNKKCGVGVAFNAKIGGCLKLLGGRVFDFMEGMALGFAHDKVDIYSSSWGPPDDGKTLARPGHLASKAILRGIREGRRGLGSIYVWASGNGASVDDCNCDGYASSIHTVTVGSVGRSGRMPWYSEQCSGILTVTFSSGEYGEPMIATTDLLNSCTVHHTGTSAAAPLAAGIIALGLEANKNLTWRDVQHLLVRTATRRPLQRVKWTKNGAGLLYNRGVGFGLMDGEALVNLAMTWHNVPEQLMFTVEANEPVSTSNLTDNKQQKMAFVYPDDGRIHHLEHIVLNLTIALSRRGSLSVLLTSPSQTEIQILQRRPHDESDEGFNGWLLMSVATWAEDPRGTWIAELTIDEGEFLDKPAEVFLIFYGTDRPISN